MFSPLEPTAPNYYSATPLSNCEHVVDTLRGTPFYGVPGPDDADILSYLAPPLPLSSSPPTAAYGCGAKVLRFTDPPHVFDAYGGYAYPVCNIGDTASSLTSDTICTIPDNIPDPGANTGQPDLDLCVSNPVNAATGNKYTAETDIVLSSGISFLRAYNSNNLSGGVKIGNNWHHSYQRELYTNPETVTATRTDGKLVYFRLVGSDWINQLQNNEYLNSIDDGNGNIIGWQLTNINDTVEKYDAAGKLLSVTGRDGRTQTLIYDTNNQLVTVTDDIGRELNFTFDGSGRIDTLTDPAGGIYTYGYDAASNLVSVTYPDNKTRVYHYNEQAYTNNTDLPRALTGITDENGIRYATYTYDTSGRAIVTEHAGGVNRHALNYDSSSNTVVTDPLGSQYTYNFQTILGVAKSTGQSQPAGSGC
ncbi:MAG: RHS repeat protein, partial [Nitrosomonas sp.]|nr:RHS repeat protein [Nitrosomonas sp.]